MSMTQIWGYLSWQSPLGLVFSLILGTCLGSFANVVIYRLPRGQSLWKPASHCPACQKPIPPYRNVPIISYLQLGGKAACCGAAISPRYVIIELLTALAFASLYLALGWSSAYLFAATWMLLLLILAGIDVEHYRLPNVLVGIGAVLALGQMIMAPAQSWLMALLGLSAGLAVGAIMLLVGKKASGQWMGLGDVKLLLVLGFYFGLGRFVLFVLIAYLAALVYAALRRQYTSKEKIPMGPFLALGAWVTFLCGDALFGWYLSLFMIKSF